MYFTFQYSKFEKYDVFCIRYQIRLICIVGAICSILFVVVTALAFNVNSSNKTATQLWLLSYGIFFIVWMSFMYIEIPWPRAG